MPGIYTHLNHPVSCSIHFHFPRVAVWSCVLIFPYSRCASNARPFKMTPSVSSSWLGARPTKQHEYQEEEPPSTVTADRTGVSEWKCGKCQDITGPHESWDESSLFRNIDLFKMHGTKKTHIFPLTYKDSWFKSTYHHSFSIILISNK